jgi:cobalamin biosynthesis protein CobT
MNRDIVVIREVVVKLVRLLTDRGITVTQQGINAFVETDPRTDKPLRVNIPHLPDNASDQLIASIQGFLDHEVAHILFTDFAVVGKAHRLERSDKKNKGIASMHNILEDGFINRKMAQKFAGSGWNIDTVYKFLLETEIDPKFKMATTTGERLRYLVVPICHAWAGQKLMQDYMEDKWHLVESFVKAVGPLKDQVPLIENSEEAFNVSVKMNEAINKFLDKAPPPPPMPSSGEGGEKQEADEGEGAGEASSDDCSGDDEEKPGKSKAEDGGGDEKGKSKKKDKDTDEETDDETKSGDDEGESQKSDAQKSTKEDDGEDPQDDRAGSEADGNDDEDDAGTGSDDDDPGDDATDAEDDQEGSGSGADEESDGAAGSDDGDEAAGEPDQTDDGDGGGVGAASGEDASEGGSDADHCEGDPDQDGTGGEESVSDGDLEWEHDFSFEDFVEGAADHSFEGSITKRINEEALDAASDAEYVVFTKDYDTIEHYPAPKQSPHVARMDDKVRHMIGTMQKELERLVAAQNRSIWHPGRRSGRVHAANLHRLAAGDGRVFRKREIFKTKDTAMSLVVDCSGSMGGSPIRTAMHAAYALSQTLERIQIEHEVIGFTTRGFGRSMGGGSKDAEIADAEKKMGRRYTRYEPLYMPVFKGFDEKLSVPVKSRFAERANSNNGLCNNIDGECVETAGHRLAQRMETRKVMIVLSDGMPHGYGDSHRQAKHLQNVVNNFNKMGIETIGIGIESTAVRKFYKKHVVLNDLEQLPGQIMKELRGIMLD